MKNNYASILLVFGLLFSFNAFSQWTQSTVTGNTGDDIQSITFADDNTAFATGWSGVVYKSTDAGLTFNKLTTTIPAIDMYATAFISATTGFVMGDLGRIYKTTDGGVTWAQKTSNTTQAIYNITILNNNTTIYAVGASGLLLKSTDSGETWAVQTSPTSQTNKSIKFVSSNESIAYLIGDNAGVQTSVYKSTDGGVNWSTQVVPASTDGDPVGLFGLSIVDETNVFICGGSKRISKTTNGSTWTNINNNTANFYRACLFTSASEGYVIGANGKIIKTTNASTFTSEASGVTDILNSIDMNSTGVYLIAGAAGKILRKGALTNTAPVANDDNGGTIMENGADGTVNVLTNDTDANGNPTTSSGHTVDLDIITPGVQTTITSPIDQSVWTYNTSTGVVTCNPATDFDGTTAMIYTLCDAGALCDNATITFTVQNTTGITENNLISKVYPNPVKDVLTIETSNKVSKIAVLGLDGKEIASYKVDSKINVSNLNTGIYFLAVTAENGLVSKTKFIKE